MHWSKIDNLKLDQFQIDTNSEFAYLQLAGSNFPNSEEFKPLRKELEIHFSKHGKAVFNVYENLNQKLFTFKVLRSSLEKIGVPDIGITAKIEKEQELKLGEKLQIIASQVKDYYTSINHNNAYRTDFDCLSFDKLLKIQEDAINLILNRDEILIGAEAGSGKTIIGCVASKYLIDFSKKERVLVVALKSIKNQWAETLYDEEMYNHTDIINYENFRNLYTIPKSGLGNKMKNKIHINPKSKFKHLLQRNYKVIIFDEVHKVRTGTSDVGICVKKYLEDKPIQHRIALSGTPMVNAATDLLGIMANFTNHPVKILNTKEFISLTETEKGQDWFIKATKHSIWYKTLAEYGIELPKLNLYFVPIKIDQKFADDYEKIMEESQTMFISPNGISKAINTATQNIRVLSAKFKKEWIINFVKNNSEKPLVVMGSFNESLMFPLGRDLNLPVFCGKSSIEERDRLKKEFMARKSDILLLNFQTGSTGLDGLQKVCSDMVIANPVWEIGEIIQAVARICRVGGQKEANIYFPFIDDDDRIISVETKMIENLKRNKAIFDKFLKDDKAAMDQLTEALKSSQSNLQQEIYAKLASKHLTNIKK